MKLLDEFKEFAVRGSVVDMAVGIVIGAAFGSIVTSLVADILMPPIGVLLGDADFQDLFLVIREGAQAPPYATLAQATAAGAVTVNYGVFINKLISFLIIALAVFVFVRGINRLRRREVEVPVAPSEKDCPYCCSRIAIGATRCPHCTAELA